MNFDDLSPELKEKAKACKSAEELLALAKEEGMEIPQDALDKIAGGIDWGCTERDTPYCDIYL